MAKQTFKMIAPDGREWTASNPVEREQLIGRGYRLAPEPAPEPAKTAPVPVVKPRPASK